MASKESSASLDPPGMSIPRRREPRPLGTATEKRRTPNVGHAKPDPINFVATCFPYSVKCTIPICLATMDGVRNGVPLHECKCIELHTLISYNLNVRIGTSIAVETMLNCCKTVRELFARMKPEVKLMPGFSSEKSDNRGEGRKLDDEELLITQGRYIQCMLFDMAAELNAAAQ